MHFIFQVLEAFSRSWASEFEHVEGERDHAVFVNDELRQELLEKDKDMEPPKHSYTILPSLDPSSPLPLITRKPVGHTVYYV